MNIFRKINDVLCKAECFLLFVCGCVLVVVVMAQVIGRYVLSVSTPWAEELARYMFCWIVPIGAGYCTARREHVDMGIINKFLDKAKNPEPLYRIWFYIGHVFEAVFLVVFAVIYWRYLQNIFKHPQFSEVLHIRMSLVMIAMFVGCILMIVQGVLLMCDATFGPKRPIKEVGR